MKQKQSGTALVTAMVIVAIAGVASTGLLERQHIDVRRTDNVLTLDQAFVYARSAELWAGQILVRDAAENTTDSSLDKWSGLLETIPVDGGSLSAQVVDQQSKFNLNNLVDSTGKASNKDVEGFQRLLAALQLDERLAYAVTDWIDADVNAALTGAEDEEYLALETPYRTSNLLMTSVTELRQVRGMSDKVYKKLLPYVTALPRHTRVNVNTASVPVLMAVVKGLSESDAVAIIEQRKNEPYADESSFRGQQALEGLEAKDISVSSDYFLIETNVQFGRSKARQHTLVERKATDKSAKIIIVARSRGNL